MNSLNQFIRIQCWQIPCDKLCIKKGCNKYFKVIKLAHQKKKKKVR